MQKFVYFDRAYLDSLFPADARSPIHVSHKPPKRRWLYNGETFPANTRSEARALIKKRFYIPRKFGVYIRHNELREVTQ